MTAAKPLARYGAIERRARERLPQHRSYTTTGDATGYTGYGSTQEKGATLQGQAETAAQLGCTPL